MLLSRTRFLGPVTVLSTHRVTRHLPIFRQVSVPVVVSTEVVPISYLPLVDLFLFEVLIKVIKVFPYTDCDIRPTYVSVLGAGHGCTVPSPCTQLHPVIDKTTALLTTVRVPFTTTYSPSSPAYRSPRD